MQRTVLTARSLAAAKIHFFLAHKLKNIAVYWTNIPHFDNIAVLDCIDNLNSVKEKFTNIILLFITFTMPSIPTFKQMKNGSKMSLKIT